MNPVRAGIVETPEEYRWSSYAQRIGIADRDDRLIKIESLSQYGCGSYPPFLSDDVANDIDGAIREAVARNQITGTKRFRLEIERKLERRISYLAPGRPRKESNR